MSQQENNERRSKRMMTDYLMVCERLDSKAEPIWSNLKDLSTRGARFMSEGFIEEGALVKVSIAVPPLKEKIEAKARVVRCRPSAKGPLYYVSVHFLELEKKAQEALSKFIERLASQRGTRFMFDHNKAKKRGFK